MVERSRPALRRDAARNRERLLTAARQEFSERGPDVPLEEVARAASVSRTTLYRNFATREELAAAVFRENVTSIEERASRVSTQDDGVVELFDDLLRMQVESRALARVLSGADVAWFNELASRTAAAFEPLLERGRRAGIVHPGVGIQDVVIALNMAGGALAANDDRGHGWSSDRILGLLHRSLFTTEPPTEQAVRAETVVSVVPEAVGS